MCMQPVAYWFLVTSQQRVHNAIEHQLLETESAASSSQSELAGTIVPLYRTYNEAQLHPYF